jgi:hypothetical protein
MQSMGKQGNGSDELALFLEFLALTLQLQSPTVASAVISELAGTSRVCPNPTYSNYLTLRQKKYRLSTARGSVCG